MVFYAGNDNSVMDSTPKLAVLLPIYNSSAYLEETVACIARQSFQDYCVIAVDDASTDNSFSYGGHNGGPIPPAVVCF